MRIFYALGCALLLWACTGEQSDTNGTTPKTTTPATSEQTLPKVPPTGQTQNGYPYQFFVQGKNRRAKEGEYTYAAYGRYADDRFIDGSYSTDKEIILKTINPSKDYLQKYPNAMMEALSMMGIGDSMMVSIPLDTFPVKPEGYENASAINLHLRLLNIKTEAEYLAEEDAARERRKVTMTREELKERQVATLLEEIMRDYNSGRLERNIIRTSSGLEYVLHQIGEGPKPVKGDRVKVHYYGVLKNGTRAESTIVGSEGKNFTVGEGKVIPAFEEVVLQLKKGSYASLYVPAELAYGSKGSTTVPPNSDLVYYFQLE